MVDISLQIDDPAIDQELIEATVEAVLAAEGVPGAAEVSILIGDDDILHSLNRDFRGVDAPTDVLSFPSEDERTAAFVVAPGTPQFLGDIAISWDRVVAQASEYGHSPQRELAFLVVHGLLHLLGYDHERSPAEEARMRAREEAILEQMRLPR